MERILVVSADSHITMPPEDVEEYLDASYRPMFEEYLEDHEIFRETFEFGRFTSEALELLNP
jgi:hypothetical protein